MVSDMPSTKGERTRQHVIEASAPLFNTRGYWGTSMSEVLDAVGLQKGGLYNHFASKDELALEALDHNAGTVGVGIALSIDPHRNAVDRLVAIIEFYRRFAQDPPFPGGCPTLNACTEADDSHPALKERALVWLHRLLDDTFVAIVERGVQRGELVEGTDPQAVAAVLFAAVEGGLMTNQVTGDGAHMDHVCDHLVAYVRGLATT
jgi:AcrR family transcriptional regulator